MIAVTSQSAVAHTAVEERPPANARLSLEAFDEFGPLGRAVVAAVPHVLVLEDALTELGGPLACLYTPAEHLL